MEEGGFFKKNYEKINIITDFFLLISFLVSAFSGIVIGFMFTGAYNPIAEILSITRTLWNEIHKISSLIFIALAVVHLVLHLNWVKMIPQFFKKNE